MPELDFIEKQKILYKSLQSCYCPVIKETVHFTSVGLQHLLYNRRRPRSLKEKVYRASLISYLIEVITNSHSVTKVSDPKINKYVLFILKYRIKKRYKGNRQIIKVILQKNGVGELHFLSAMSKKVK